jgi:hypothetical protein
MRLRIAAAAGAFLAGVFLVCLGAASAAPAGKLAPNDIQSTFFNGQPFTSSTPSQAITYKMVFGTDGTMTREPQGKSGVKGEGNWKLSKDGFCTTWKNSPQNCFTLVSGADNKYSVMKGNTLVGIWSK